MKVSLSILTADFANMEESLKDVLAITDYVHMDIMDGEFVPNISVGPAFQKAIRRLTDKPFDTHLMIMHPQNYIKQFVEAYPKYQEQSFCNYLLSENLYLEDVRHYLLQDLYSHGKRIEKFLDKNNLNTYRVVDGKIGADLLIQSGIDDDIIRKSGNQEFYSKNFTDLDRDSLISFDIDTIKKI